MALYALLIAGALEALVPVLWILSGSLQSAEQLYKGTDPIPHPFEWGNFATAWNEGGFSQYLPNSLLYTAASVLGILVIASMAGYALARIEFPGRGVVVGAILVIMIIPLPAVVHRPVQAADHARARQHPHRLHPRTHRRMGCRSPS